MRSTLRGFLVLALGLATSALAGARPIDVWMDVDPAMGLPGRDVDDGLALLMAFHSPEIRVRGVSVVFGNSPLHQGLPIAREIVRRFGPEGVTVNAGAPSPISRTRRTPAVEAMAAALRERPLVLLALGPVTNVAGLLEQFPELEDRIERIVLVAGRRPGQRFVSSARQPLPHPDFNFELDPRSMQTLLDSTVELVYAPWEVSSHVWLSREDLEDLRTRGASGRFVHECSRSWLSLWEKDIGPAGFNPFDTLAVGWLVRPESIEGTPMFSRIARDTDDRNPRKKKPYLLARRRGHGREVLYLHTPRAEFHELLMERLGGRR